MRLISKIHDYYDPLTDSSDKSLIFKRDNQEINLDLADELYSLSYCIRQTVTIGNYDRTCYIESSIVGFCGKIYPVIKLNFQYAYEESNIYYCYDMESVNQHFNWNEVKTNSRILFSVSDIENWFNGSSSRWLDRNIDFRKKSNLLNMFKKHNVAYFHIYNGRIELYPILKKINFYKVFDIYSCMTALENYLTNELAPPDSMKILPISDKLKAETHGFDKHSFRKEKQK